MFPAASLFDAPPSPPLPAAAEWVSGTVTGTLAATLCVLAVAFVGLLLTSGRLALRDAARVALACFVVLGAAAIAEGLRGAAGAAAPENTPEPVAVAELPPPPPLPPANYDPYAGASLRQD